MDGYIHLGMLVAAAIILLFVLFDAWFRDPENHDAPAKEPADEEIFDFTVEERNAHQEPQLSDAFSAEPAPAQLSLPVEENQDSVANPYEPYQSGDLRNTELPTQDFYEEEPVAPAVPVAASSAVNKEIKNAVPVSEDLLVLSVIAKPNCYFASYDLVQAITARGLEFGAMNIFHYYQSTLAGKFTLFSLSSVTEPGEFDLNQMGDFSCSGLLLFVQLDRVPDPYDAFKTMLETAQQLAEDLDGELHSDPHTPWNDNMMKKYQKKIAAALEARLTENV